jgi:quercetin dioxygenase-like cupin family protein
MNDQRIFNLEKIACFSEQGATVTPVIETENSSIAVWGVQPQQIVQPHSHPDGQDTWVMLKGTLIYYLGDHQSQILQQGEVAIAEKNQVHGAINHSQENAIFVSIYSAPKIGYQRELG